MVANAGINRQGDVYIAAPMRFAADEPSWFVFNKCRLTGSNTKDGVYLGRPWRDYGRAIFLETSMDGHIRPEGWNHADQGLREKDEADGLGPAHAHGERCLHLAGPDGKQSRSHNFRHKGYQVQSQAQNTGSEWRK
mgnify:CR=1 FL=1